MRMVRGGAGEGREDGGAGRGEEVMRTTMVHSHQILPSHWHSFWTLLPYEWGVTPSLSLRRRTPYPLGHTEEEEGGENSFSFPLEGLFRYMKMLSMHDRTMVTSKSDFLFLSPLVALVQLSPAVYTLRIRVPERSGVLFGIYHESPVPQGLARRHT